MEGAAQLEALADELEGLRSGLAETEQLSRRTLGARGLSYYGMDSTYASSLAILRRILRLEGALD